MYNGETCEAVPEFDYYNISDLEFVRNIERSKSCVYLCRQRYSKELIVVKEFRLDHLTIQQVARKIEILRMVQELNHPNIVRYKGLSRLIKRIGSTYMESLLIFMEYCEKNLYELALERAQHRESLTEEEILEFLRQIVDPLERLERWGIAHRDIKLQNILVSENTYKLCDFQDSLRFSAENSSSDLFIHITTVEFSTLSMLNEIKSRKKKVYDPFKVDVYALGITTLILCSQLKFNPVERISYTANSIDHKFYMKQNRKKFVKKRFGSGGLNRMMKLMLEEDEYKRENFITLKMKLDNLKNMGCYDLSKSENSSTSASEKRSTTVPERASIQEKACSVQSSLVIYLSMLLIILVLLCIY